MEEKRNKRRGVKRKVSNRSSRDDLTDEMDTLRQQIVVLEEEYVKLSERVDHLEEEMLTEDLEENKLQFNMSLEKPREENKENIILSVDTLKKNLLENDKK